MVLNLLSRRRPQRSLIMGFFVMCVALAAAVLGDAAVEGLSDASLLWHGRYTDSSSIDLLPVAVVATVVFLALLGVVVLHQAREHGLSTRSLILSTARVLTPRAVARVLPLMLAVQLAVLYVMETLEQFAVYHHAFGGTVWLGGPVAASLIVHTALTVACATALARIVHAVAAALLQFAGFIIARYVAVAESPAACIARVRRIVCVRQNGIRIALVDRGPRASHAAEVHPGRRSRRRLSAVCAAASLPQEYDRPVWLSDPLLGSRRSIRASSSSRSRAWRCSRSSSCFRS